MNYYLCTRVQDSGLYFTYPTFNKSRFQIEEMCLEAEDICKREGVEGVAVIGNYLYPNAVSVSGSDYALSLVSDLTTQNGGKAKRLKVAGAFHSPLMAGASVALRRVLG